MVVCELVSHDDQNEMQILEMGSITSIILLLSFLSSENVGFWKIMNHVVGIFDGKNYGCYGCKCHWCSPESTIQIDHTC